MSLLLAELLVRAFVPVRNVGPAFSTFDETYGKRLKRSVHCRRVTPEFTMQFTTNSLGFRGPEPASLPLRHVLLFLGDSFTMGYGVDDGFEFPAVVGQALVERLGPAAPPVLNAGIGDAGNGHALRFLQREATRYAPRGVVLQLCGNDFDDNRCEGLYAIDPTGGLTELPPRSVTWKRCIQSAVEAVPGLADSHLLGLVRQAAWGFDRAPAAAPEQPTATGTPPPDDDSRRAAEPLTFALIRECMAACRDRGWPLLVIAVEWPADHRDALIACCAEFDVPLLEAPTRADEPSLYYRIDGHWNPRGHELMARRVAEHLLLDPRFGLDPAAPRRLAPQPRPSVPKIAKPEE